MEMEAGKMTMDGSITSTDGHEEHADMAESHRKEGSEHSNSTHTDHMHPIGAHEMESSGLGDLKLSALIPLFRTERAVFLLNAGLSIPTGSIEVGRRKRYLILPDAAGIGIF